MAPTQNATHVRILLGFTNYVPRFIEVFVTVKEPLRQLTLQDTLFSWTSECQNALNELKTRLASETMTVYYDLSKPTGLTVDSSPMGLGAVLVQTSTSPKGEEEVRIMLCKLSPIRCGTML